MVPRWKRKKGELSRVVSSRVELVPCSGKAAYVGSGALLRTRVQEVQVRVPARTANKKLSVLVVMRSVVWVNTLQVQVRVPASTANKKLRCRFESPHARLIRREYPQGGRGLRVNTLQVQVRVPALTANKKLRLRVQVPAHQATKKGTPTRWSPFVGSLLGGLVSGDLNP
ncbi:unnamed protein product [Boreogadus saida]